MGPELETLRSEFNARWYDARTSGASRNEILAAFYAVAGALARE
jgi:hypothetical protein